MRWARTAPAPFPARRTDTDERGQTSTRSYARLSQPEMLQRLRDFQAGRYTPRSKYERQNLRRRLRDYERQGVAVEG